MYKVIEEREEMREVINTVIYEYDHESLESALNHIDLMSNQDCKCYIGSDDKKSEYRRNLMELNKGELIDELIRKSADIHSVEIHCKESIGGTFFLGDCDLYIGDNEVYEKVRNVEVTLK